MFSCFRILYGKMKLKAGRDASSRAQTNARKSTIMAFIASSQPSDIEVFFDIIFQPFQQFFLGNKFILYLFVIDANMFQAVGIIVRDPTIIYHTISLMR